MKKVKGLVSVLLSASLMFSLAACTEKETYSDYYTFDTGSIAGELLYGSSMKIEPVIRNLGEVVDADYNVKVTFDGQDVTSSVYNAETKTFAPAEQADAIGLYTFTLTVVDEQGNEIEDDSGEAFSTSFTVDYCIMNFVPKASAGAGIDVNNDDPLSPVISFGENYTGEGLNDSGQYRVTGVNFSGDYEIVYKVKADAISGATDTRFHFGVDRTDENKRDDNIALNVEDGTLSAWFFDDNGTASGSDWTGTGWISTEKSVSNYQSLADGSEHLIGFTRIINETSGNAHYVVTWDGEYFTSLNIKGNWTDTVGAVWVESQNVQGSIGVESFRQLENDTQAPTLQLHYEDMGIGSSVSLMDGIVIEDNIYDAYDTIEWTVTDPNGEDVTPANGQLTLSEGGVYTITAVVTDLKGNVSQTETATITVYSDFSIRDVGFDKSYKAGSEIALNVSFTSDDQGMRDEMRVRILKDGVDTGISVTGDAVTGFRFTPVESGVYVAEVSTVSEGKSIVKTAEFAVSGASAGEIDISRNTSVARTLVSHILYADAAEDVTLRILKGDSYSEAEDVTAQVVGTHTTKTLEENITYTFFTPDAEGRYYLEASSGEGDARALRVMAIDARSDATFIYDDEKLDVANAQFDKVIFGNNMIIFRDNGSTGYNTSKLVYNNNETSLNLTDNFTIEFKITDLEFHNANKKLFFSLGMKGEGFTWNDITVEGSPKSEDKPDGDLWGYCTNLLGYGWVEYQWRSTWQAPVTDEFIPDNDPGYEGDTPQYAFRDGSEYSQYGVGTHTYRIEFRKMENNTFTVLFYIDGRPEATHRNLKASENILDVVVINSDTMSGVLTDIRFTQD